MPRSGRYSVVLAIPGARRLLASAILARMPLGMSSLAILLLLRQRTGSFAVAGVGVGVFALAQAAAAPIQGVLVDRLGQRPILLPAAAIQSALLGLLVAAALAGAPAGGLVTVAGFAGAFTPPVGACLRALWAQVAPAPAQREAAYSLDAVSQEIVWTVGPLAVAAVVTFASPAAAVVLCAAMTLGGTLAFAASRFTRRATGRQRPRARGGALASPGLRVVLLTAALMGVGIGSVEVGLPALAVRLGSSGASGAFLSLWSIGSMIAGLWYGARRWRRPVDVRYGLLLATIAVTTAPLLGARSVLAGALLSALAGVAFAPTLSCQMALIGALAPDGAVTEAFTWSNAALVVGISGGSALAGGLAQGAGVAAPFAVGCAGFALAAGLALSRRARFARPAPAPLPE